MAKTKKARKVKSVRKTYVALVLDRSGSMASCYNEALNGFNAQLKVIREESDKEGQTFVTVVVFNSEAKVLQEAVGIDGVENLTQLQYRPQGGTAMYDAVMEAITTLEKYDDKEEQTAFLVVTISDGEENASKKFGSKELAEKIQDLQNTNRWTFGYVGANQDLSAISRRLNLSHQNTLSYTSTPRGTQQMYFAANASVGDYMKDRSKGITSKSNLFSQPNSADSSPLTTFPSAPTVTSVAIAADSNGTIVESKWERRDFLTTVLKKR